MAFMLKPLNVRFHCFVFLVLVRQFQNTNCKNSEQVENMEEMGKKRNSYHGG